MDQHIKRVQFLEKLLARRDSNPVLDSLESKLRYRKFQGELAIALSRQSLEVIKSYTFQTAIKNGQIIPIVRLIRPLDNYISRKVFADFFVWTGSYGIQSGIDKVAIALKKIRRTDEGFFAQEALNAIRERSGALISHLDDTSKRQLADRLAKMLEKGYSFEEMAQNLTERYPQLCVNRSRMIVTTETNWAVSHSELATYQGFGATSKTWVTAGDERVCEVCAEMDGATIGIEDAFSSSDPSWIDLPGNFAAAEPAYHPPIHIVCRCWIEPVFEKSALTDLETSDVNIFVPPPGSTLLLSPEETEQIAPFMEKIPE